VRDFVFEVPDPILNIPAAGTLNFGVKLSQNPGGLNGVFVMLLIVFTDDPQMGVELPKAVSLVTPDGCDPNENTLL